LYASKSHSQGESFVPYKGELGCRWRIAGYVLFCTGVDLGFLLTTSDKGQAVVNVHGPKNLMHYIATFRNFIFR